MTICARDPEELARAEEEVASRGEALAVVCDVTRREDVERAIEWTSERPGPMDVLVNNAGVMKVGPLETMTDEDFREALDVHVWGPIRRGTASYSRGAAQRSLMGV